MENAVIKPVLYYNGKILTMDEQDTIAEAVLTIGERIAAVGKTADLMRQKLPDTQLVDLAGKTLMPGLIDGHVHLEMATTDMVLGRSASTPPCESLADILEVIKKAAAETPPGEWVVVRGTLGYDKKIRDQRGLTRRDIDAVVDSRPVAFFPAIHVCVLNTKGIERMGWWQEKDIPVNATLGRDPETGELTGVYCEAWGSGSPLSPWPYETRKEAMYEGTMEYFVKLGITSAYEIPYSFDGIRAWQDLKREGRMPLRVTMYPPDLFLLHGAKDFLQYGLTRGFGDDWVRIGGMKFFADGIGLHANGYPIKCLHYTQEELNELVYLSHAAGMQIWTHAMSEEAFEQTLLAYENALAKLPKEDHRMQIEHSGDVIGKFSRQQEYLRRMLDAGIGAMMTPTFQHFGVYYDKDDALHTRSLIDMGFKLRGNSDTTGSSKLTVNPWFAMWCAVTRKNYWGQVINPAERITVMEALKMYTIWAALGAFEEKIKGSIEPGKLADLIILRDDPLTCEADALKDMVVETVVIGGDVRCRATL